MTTKANSVIDLTLDQIKGHPRNVRHEVTDLEDLTASIKAQGILQPLVVAPAAPGLYTLIAGHRRHAAATAARLSTVPCLIRNDLTNESDQVLAMIAENSLRSDLNPVEEGDAYQALLDLGVTPAKIAKTAGRTAKLVKERVKVSKAPDVIRSRVASREITLEVAMVLQQYAHDQEQYERLDKFVGTTNWSWAVAGAKREAANKVEIAKIAEQLTAEGVTVCVDPRAVEAHRAEQVKARGENLYAAELGTDRPDDADSTDVYVTFLYGSPANQRWYRLVSEAAIDGADETSHGAVRGAASNKAREDDRERERVEAERRDAERARITEGLTTAASVRRSHLADTLRAADDAMAHTCLHTTLADALEHSEIDELEFIADILGIEQHGEATDWDQAAQQIVDLAQAFSTAKLAVLIRLVEQAHRETELAFYRVWNPMNYSRRDYDKWRHQLGTTFGYEWSDIENELLEHLANNPAE